MPGAGKSKGLHALYLGKALGADRVQSGAGFHGGVGFTWDFDIQLFLKRGKLHEYAFGDASFHRERVAQIVLDGGVAGPPLASPPF